MGTRLLLLLLTCLQSPGEALTQAIPSADSAASTTDAAELRSQTLPLNELREKIANGEYLPIPRSRMDELAANARRTTEPRMIDQRPKIREGKYSAEFSGTRLESGQLTFQLYDDTNAPTPGPLLLGSTSLQNLSLADSRGPIQLAADASHRLFLLKTSVPSVLTGQWSADGQVAGDVVTFLLELPASTTSSLTLTTPARIQVTSAGSLVLGPETDGDKLKWTLIPSDPARFRFSCRRKPGLVTQAPLPLAEFSSTHTLSADLLTSRWSLLLPSSAEAGTNITSRISSFVRVTDVSLDDQRPVEWLVRQENGQSLLALVLPDSSASASLTVTATSVLPQRESWDLPMLSPLQWTNTHGARRGPVLMPIGQMNVLLPAAVELDEWILVGIQERDVVTRPDQSREYQLVQFLPEASAAVRTSTSPARLTDSVVTLLEPAGRLATVRCLIHVTCEGSSVVELKWPVASGWQVIAARQVSDGRSLFFEFPAAAPEDDSTELTIHLPNTLDSGSSGLFELQLQQADTADLRTLRPPMLKNTQMDRSGSIVVFPPAFSLNSDLQRRWSDGRRLLTVDELERQLNWLPLSRLTNDMKPYDVTNADSGTLTLPPDTAASESSLRIEYAAQLNAGLLTEVTQIELPPSINEVTSSFLIPEEINGDMRWTIDGEPVAARRDPEHSAGVTWCRWTMPPGTIRSGRRTVVRCETRRPAPQDTKEFNASIVFPESSEAIQGTVTLTETESGVLSTNQLTQNTSDPSRDLKTTSWRLPSQKTLLKLQLSRTPRIQQGQTIDVQMLHLIEERAGSLHHEILAIASVSQLGGRTRLQLSIPASLRPLVLVNGHQVQLTENKDGLFVPLPANSTEAQILLTWTAPDTRTVSLTGSRLLPRLFHNELAEPQSTHHLLIDPLLELSAPQSDFASTERTDILPILSRVPGALSNVTPSKEGGGIISHTPPQVRSFVTRWQLASSRHWQPRTLIDAAASEKAINIEVTRMRRRLAIFTGMFLMMIGGSVVLRSLLNRYRLAFAFIAAILLGMSFLTTTQVQTEILRGAFWGLTGGLMLVLLSRWQGLRFWLKQHWLPSLRTVVSSLLVLLVSWNSTTTTHAFQVPSNPAGSSEPAVPRVIAAPADPSTASASRPATNSALMKNDSAPDILIPSVSVADIVYARRDLVESQQSRQLTGSEVNPAAVLTSMHSIIRAENSSTVEIVLRLNVAVASSSRTSRIRLPLQGALLEDCRVDNMNVSPEPDGTDAISISIPGSAMIEPRAIAAANLSPDKVSSSDASPIAASAESLTEFEYHVVECRLRPVTVQQSSGVQFQIPALPCPAASIEIDVPQDTFSRVRAKTPSGILQWSPQEGTRSLNSLVVNEGVEIRLFQSGIERGSPQSASVDTLAIGETLSGQYQLTCIARFKSWNPLTPDVRYRVPNGYELMSVSASVGPDMVDLLWSVNDQNTVIQLPDGIGGEFLLALQLRAITPVAPLEQAVPVAELQQFADCTVNDSLLLAVRPNPVFSVLPLEGQQIVTASFAELQTAWGQWLRRSDTVFRVPRSNAACTIRLVPRESRNEVRIDQAVTVRDSEINWACRFDIDTTVLPVFRHRLTIDPSIIVTDVQVVAGEANRLASWHRRGDQLTIQLREGTTGQHQISITGRQPLRPDDVLLTLNTPRLQRAQILESAMTLLDNDGLGLSFEKLGGAVPDLRIEDGAVLLPETSVRMQIVREQDPVILKRLRPVEPVGSTVAIRSAEQVTFVVRVTRWSGTLGPLHLVFPSDAEFLIEPFVILDSQKMPLTGEGNDFAASQEIVKALFDQPEFIVSWSMPFTADTKTESVSFTWPELFDGIRWEDLLLVPLDADPGSSEELAGTTSLPEWLKTTASLATGKDLTALKARMISLPLPQQMSDHTISIPVRRAPDRVVPETTRNLFAIADSTVWIQPNHSAVGETLFIIFASRYPERCSIRIPPGTVVTELDSSAPARWQTTGREQVTVELSSPVTTLRTRWMSERAAGNLTTISVQTAPPYPNECESRQLLTAFSSTGDQPQIPIPSSSLSAEAFGEALLADVKAGLNHAQPLDDQTSSANISSPASALPSEQSLLELCDRTRSRFLETTGATITAGTVPAHCRPINNSPVRIEMNRQADWTTVAALFMGTSVILIATFARLLNSLPFLLLPRRSTVPQALPSGPTTVLHTASARSAHSGSQARPSTGSQSVPKPTPDKPASSVEVRNMDRSE